MCMQCVMREYGVCAWCVSGVCMNVRVCKLCMCMYIYIYIYILCVCTRARVCVCVCVCARACLYDMCVCCGVRVRVRACDPCVHVYGIVRVHTIDDPRLVLCSSVQT